MKHWLFSILVLLTPPLWSQETDPAVALRHKNFQVESVIIPALREKAAPPIWQGLTKLHLPITTHSENARTHVRQGFALLHASWDFEAYRHFCQAAKEDDTCLMAYVGIALSLVSPTHEFYNQRNFAIERMLDLAEHKEEGEFYFPEPERGYAFGTGVLLTNGIQNGLQAFQALTERYPNDVQAAALTAFMNRGGYDALGLPTPKQKTSIETLTQLKLDYPKHTSVLHFWLMLHAEAPALRTDLSAFLPTARQLVEMAPELPTAHYLQGHFQFRCGLLKEAQTSFQTAIRLYAKWQQDQSIPLSDCDGLIKARLYLASTLYTLGKFDAALKEAKILALLPINEKRPHSSVSKLLLWEAKTLPAKLYYSRAASGDLTKAQEVMPSKKDVLSWLPHSPAPLHYENLHLYLAARKALKAKQTETTLELQNRLSQSLLEYQQAGKQVIKSSEYSEYLRGHQHLSILSLELSGLIAESSVGSANWYTSAAEYQKPSSNLMPPAELYPMELRLAEYYLSQDKKEQAKEALQQAQLRRPSHFALKALREKLQ